MVWNATCSRVAAAAAVAYASGVGNRGREKAGAVQTTACCCSSSSNHLDRGCCDCAVAGCACSSTGGNDYAHATSPASPHLGRLERVVCANTPERRTIAAAGQGEVERAPARGQGCKHMLQAARAMHSPGGKWMAMKKTPPAYGLSAGPMMVACQWNKSSPTGPAEQSAGQPARVVGFQSDPLPLISGSSAAGARTGPLSWEHTRARANPCLPATIAAHTQAPALAPLTAPSLFSSPHTCWWVFLQVIQLLHDALGRHRARALLSTATVLALRATAVVCALVL